MKISKPAFIASRAPREQAFIFGLLVLVVIAVLYKLLSGGGGEAAFDPIPRTSARPTPTPTAVSTLPVVPVVIEGKDPFEPLVSAASAPGPSGGPAPAPGPSGGPSGGGSNPSGSSRRVTLVDVFTRSGERMATVTVDGTEYTVHVGDTFADNYRLLSLTSSCGNFVFGDERFTLCIGQEVRK